VAGAPPQPQGRVELPLRKLTRTDGWRMIVDAAGQPAVTDYRVLAQDAAASWLELRPRTGRTHQIRVHCAALGCPVLGDPLYGTGGGPLQLHSRAVTLPLYPGKPPVAVEAPPPPHMAELLARHGWAAPAAPGAAAQAAMTAPATAK
jgi:tRNA pseudouridine32 synthase/23S rRNA pseudouridine746 synthase/23S rRNA pseudouridine1911/1915/1917 synthase